MKYITLYPQMVEQIEHEKQTQCIGIGIVAHEGVFVDLLNKEMEELKRSMEKNGQEQDDNTTK